MTKAIKRIEESLVGMERLGSRLSTVFLALFIAICIALTAYLGLAVFRLSASPEAPDAYAVLQLASASLDCVIFGIILLVMRGIAKDVASGRSPFTIAHAKRIKAVAWLLLIGFVLSAIVSPGFASIAGIGGLDFGLASSHVTEYPIVPVDAKSIVGALVCFSLSSVWKYGALLQADSDDFL